MAGDDTQFTFRTWPFFWLMRAQGSYLARMEEELAPIGLDLPRWRVLMTLHEERVLSVSELAGHASAKLPTMTKIVQRMQADGLVTLGTSTIDARVTEVTLSPAGEVAGDKAWEAADRVYRRAFGRVPPRRLQSFTAMLEEVTARLD